MTDQKATLKGLSDEDLIEELQSRFPWGCVFIWSNDGDDTDWWHSGGLNACKGMVDEVHSDMIGRGCSEVDD